MAELEKLGRVAGKVVPGAPHQVLLVLDATTGQNGLSQGRAFAQAVGVNGVVLSKLDTSARGGVALAVAAQLGVPILYASLGEGPDDLIPFQREAYVEGLLADVS
jgi:fused signal recognition particle receptor